MTFDEDMDTSVKPPAAFFELIVDTVTKTPDTITWLNDRVLGVEYSEAVLGPTEVIFAFPAPHPLLRTALLEQIGTFSNTGFEMVPTGEFEYSDPNLVVEVTFPIDMNQTVVPTTAEMFLYDNAVQKVPDAISWISARILKLEYAEAGLTQDVDVELPTPTPNLVCLADRQVCPFRQNGLNPI